MKFSSSLCAAAAVGALVASEASVFAHQQSFQRDVPHAKRQLIAVSGNSIPVANDLVHNSNVVADVLGQVAQLDASSQEAAPAPAKRHVQDLEDSITDPADLFEDPGLIDNGANSKRQLEDSQLGDALPGAVSEAREARVNALHRLAEKKAETIKTPASKRQLVAIAQNTIPVANDLVHNNNIVADVLGDVKGLDASNKAAPPAAAAPEGETSAAPSGAAPGSEGQPMPPPQHPEEDTTTVQKQCQSQAQSQCTEMQDPHEKTTCQAQVQTQCEVHLLGQVERPDHALGHVLGSQRLAREKRQQLPPLVAVTGNSVPVANDVAHNNNIVVDLLGQVQGLDASSK